MKKKNLSVHLFIILLTVFILFPQTSFSQETDFKWLLKYSGKSTNDVAWDKRFNNFLLAETPKISLDLGMGKSYLLKSTVKEFIGGPPEDVSITNNEIIILSACRAHSCPEKAWLWCNIKTGVVVGAVVHYIFRGKYSENPSLLLFSNQVMSDSVPEQCQKDLENWLNKNEIVPRVRRFVDKKGKIT